MSKVKIKGNASGTGVLTIEAPNTNTDRTITLPDGTGTLLTTDGDGSALTGVGGGGAMEFISKQVASGVTSVEFTGISTSYKHLEIRVSSTNSTVGGAKIQFGSSGTYTTSGYRRFGTSSSYIHLITYTGSAAKDLNTIVHIGNLGESSNTLFSSESEGWETAYAYQTSNFGVLESSSSMDSIKIYHSSAFNGTFSLYGIKDS